jgi:nudix-type nucleoside diphosphatase (YffH/AdpP family)
MEKPGNIKIIKEHIVYDERLVIEEAKLESDGRTYTRQRINCEDAVAVLLLNTDSNKVVLTRQFRYAISSKTTEHILEIVAGKVEGDDSPTATAIREVEEETGYRLSEASLRPLLSCFSSPGYSSEQFFIYYGTVTNADKVAKGGGLEKENEHIEVIEMPVDTFTNLVRDGMIKDSKTYIAGMYMILQWH